MRFTNADRSLRASTGGTRAISLKPQAEFCSKHFYLIVDRRSLIAQAIELRLKFSIRHSNQRRQPCFPSGSARQRAHPR